jgi:hypothetical protein
MRLIVDVRYSDSDISRLNHKAQSHLSALLASARAQRRAAGGPEGRGSAGPTADTHRAYALMETFETTQDGTYRRPRPYSDIRPSAAGPPSLDRATACSSEASEGGGTGTGALPRQGIEAASVGHQSEGSEQVMASRRHGNMPPRKRKALIGRHSRANQWRHAASTQKPVCLSVVSCQPVPVGPSPVDPAKARASLIQQRRSRASSR